jgi:hypothetical protein
MAVMLGFARTMLRCGMGYSEFAELCKQAFVEAAADVTEIQDRRNNTARVSVVTGLSRKEVSRIRREHKDVFRESLTSENPAAELLHRWFTDSAYLDAMATPRALPFEGDKPSFCDLVKEVAGDVPAGAIRTELLRAGAICEAPDGLLLATTRHFVPGDVDERILQGLGFGVRTLAETVAFNSDPVNQESGRFQREVHSPQIEPDRVEQVREVMRQVLTDLSIQVDDFLSAIETTSATYDDPDLQEYVRIGVGLYYTDEEVESAADLRSSSGDTSSKHKE